MSARPRLSPRQRRLVLATVATVAGTSLIGLAVWWIEARRSTDLADARAGVTSTFTAEARAATTPVRFTDVTAAAGIAMRHGASARRRALPEDNASGLAWGDYDGDRWPDLYVVNHPGILGDPADPAHANRLFRNRGDGTFEDVTELAGVGDAAGFGMGATFVDYDADGHLDLHVTNLGTDRLYRNNGDGTFTDVAARAGVASPLWSTGAAWGDYDRDGHVDVYVCHYVDYDAAGREPPAAVGSSGRAGDYEAPYTINPSAFNPQPNTLYRNRGDGTFEDVTRATRVADPDGRSLSATFCDLDGDGWLDLYVANDVSPNRLFRNTGGDYAATGPGETGEDFPVTFIDLSAFTGTADTRGSMGISVGDFGGLAGEADDLPDLFLSHWLAQENALYLSLRGRSGQLEYRDRARPLRLGEVSIDRVGWGTAVLDIDLDGRADIAVANGSTLERPEDGYRLKPEPMFLFVNDGDGFRDIAPIAGEATAIPRNARGLAAADFDCDGDIDLALAVNQGSPVLLRNDTERGGHHALSIRLAGPEALARGARIEVHQGTRHQLRWWAADVSYLSGHAAESIFGLGDSPRADLVRVRWMDGRVTEIRDVPAGDVRLAHADAVMPAP
ncbi:MAG: CRTAC1 family protein [Opitutaceae bacterium]|nr:CRTAC1 family protein [Opitutaceae bacterium]